MPAPPAACHVGGVEAAELRVRQVVQEDDPLDALGGRAEDVEEREDSGVVDEHVNGDSLPLGECVQLFGGSGPGQVDLRDADLGGGTDGGSDLLPDGLQRFAAVARQHEVVASRRQPQGIAAADARSGARHEGPGAAGRDLSAPPARVVASGVHGRRSSSSTIFRGRSGQCLQHFMSTEYMRAMQ